MEKSVYVIASTLVFLAFLANLSSAVIPAKIYGDGEADAEELKQGSYIFFLSPKATQQELDDTVQRVNQLSLFIQEFKVQYIWNRINGFVVRNASPTMARLIAEMKHVEFGAIIQLTCDNGAATGCC